jgi:N-acetyl-alpha-D-muramate 1-phosphate uridylyltransferase
MKTAIGHTAMVLAAGLGTRMRPLTDVTPKPLIKVCGKPIIEYGFEHLRKAGVTSAVVNTHYLPDQIKDWSARQTSPAVTISDETDTILDTGGGIARALPHLGNSPFFVLNSDSFWIDEGKSALIRLREKWEDTMECLLLLCDPAHTTGYDGQGDFVINSHGHLTRASQKAGKAYVYIGAYLVHPKLFSDAPNGKFSMNVLFDRAIKRNTLFGMEHHGHWIHVGTPDAIAEAERYLKQDDA